MNYRHIFHAGNFADVLKHVVLTLLLEALARKDAPFAYIDTHAGVGQYDLQAPQAGKTGEYRDGIGRLWDADGLPPQCAAYMDIVRALNPDGVLRWYPGSPWIAHALRRTHDRLVLAERQPQECAQLQILFGRTPRTALHCQDGLAGLKAWLPPTERRGLVLIDPPYERDTEWDEVVAALAAAYRRWPTGCYALWYPIKAQAPLARFNRALAAAGFDKVLRAELTVYPVETPARLNGCGMVVINPPWQVDQAVTAALSYLGQRLRQGPAGGVQIHQEFPGKTNG